MTYSNSADADQTASERAVWSGSTLFTLHFTKWYVKQTFEKQKLYPKSIKLSFQNLRISIVI